jgi:EAL domain-containing protein (putative c-di-GMP-specific phosphodiesterase class I)
MRRADVALYRAKEQPGSAYLFYDEAMDVALGERIRLESNLKRALSEDLIVPHYQPIVDLRTGEILKLEALARWLDPKLGEIPPARFIPLAEERGLIAEVTERIVRRSCLDAVGWPDRIILAVNISPLLLESNTFPLRLVKILADTGLRAGRLEVEITERALKAETVQVRAFIESLRSAGVRIALDDFGTGYSSLARLRELPFDEIKIDGSFVQSLAANADSAVIIRAVIQLGRGLGMAVTAEGIEEAGQRDSLMDEGCRHGQGFLFSKALPADQILALFDSHRRAATG